MAYSSKKSKSTSGNYEMESGLCHRSDSLAGSGLPGDSGFPAPPHPGTQPGTVAVKGHRVKGLLTKFMDKGGK
jgi:hypothetical protein